MGADINVQMLAGEKGRCEISVYVKDIAAPFDWRISDSVDVTYRDGKGSLMSSGGGCGREISGRGRFLFNHAVCQIHKRIDSVKAIERSLEVNFYAKGSDETDPIRMEISGFTF